MFVKSYPFFVKGLSFGDVLFDTREEKNDVLDVEWKDKSGNSTIWMACRSQDDFDELYDCLREQFNVEGLAEFNLLSVCLMEWQALKELDEAVEGLGNSISFEIAYPSLRHEEV
ncbi:hypothetical protein ACMU_07130 [Actibacterium mucosum KCTC 23349]|uniref:Uncharacterized protein n=1 Tax=Actibacterium mucosum KCTC 23349 TaxID=1454373 RepID=A0A037ZPE7_9RHOB|nr:hypothetical protein ACMU_07130 [Actibacterium mucosum KCTC 23349]